LDTPIVSSNVELARSIYAAWERGDWSSAAWAHPEIEFVIADGPVPFTAVGLRAMAENWRGWLGAWEHFSMTAEEFRELDGERVLVLHRYSGRGKTSGVNLDEVQAEAAILLHVRDGRVTRLVGYNDREHALSDVGLSPGEAAR
jgi:ketosteroid isomerase-like protein